MSTYVQLLVEQRRAKRVLHELESRQEDIFKLESSIRQLNQMFADMALLIEHQVTRMERPQPAAKPWSRTSELRLLWNGHVRVAQPFCIVQGVPNLVCQK